MKKVYYKPHIIIEKMNTPLLEDVSNIKVGGSGTLDAKDCASNHYDDFNNDYDEY